MSTTSMITKDASYRLKRLHVLVVDNDAAVTKLMSDVLNRLGFGTTHIASDGFQAIDILRQNKIDLMITDWNLKAAQHNHDELPPNPVIISTPWSPCPPSDGSLFLKFLRVSKNSPNPYLCVIMMTVAALQENIAYARDSGVNEILIKPVTAESLCRHIMMVVDNHRPFITAHSYRGPCRRRKPAPCPAPKERRIKDIKVIKFKG